MKLNLEPDRAGENITKGFSMSMPYIARNPVNLSRRLYNVFIMRNINNLMCRMKGQEWIDEKNEKAIKRTNAAL